MADVPRPSAAPSATAFPPHQRHVLGAILLCLAGAAGYVDAVGYLAFEHIFVANMTGNSVLLGIAAVEGHTDATLRSVIALAGFVAGAAVGTAITDARETPKAWPVPVTTTLALEAAVLVVVAAGWALLPQGAESTLRMFIVVTAVAMGLQSAAARKLAVPGVSTVVLTSTLTTLVARAVAHVRHRKWKDPSPRDVTRGPGILFGVWAAYVAGAGLGAWIAHAGPRFVLVAPALLVSLVALGAVRTFHGPEAPPPRR